MLMPTTVLHSGTVRTMVPGRAPAEAIVLRDGAVAGTGTSRDMLALAGPEARAVDLAGRAVLPGFIETHNHPVFFGLTLAAAVEAGTPPNDTIGDIADRVEQAVRDAEPGAWVRGYRYDDSLLAEDRHPTRHDLDPVSPDNPVCLMHISGHFCVVNSAALAALGIDRDSADPQGGVIARDDAGEPTGLLVETAAFAAYAAMPDAEPEELVSALGLAGDAYLAAGVTTVCDLGLGLTGGRAELAAYRSAITDGRLRTRVRAYLVPDLIEGLAEGDVRLPALQLDGVDRDAFRVLGAKLWADGSIQGLTGALDEGYACAPDQVGMLLHPPEELARLVATLHATGLQVAVHGNGDRAIQTILDAYDALGAEPVADDRRHRIEHCQMAHEEQLAQMAESAVLASFFIKHVYYWGDRHRDRFLGAERAATIDPLASARGHGVRFGLHSDTPIVPVDPLEGIWCAVNRVTRDGHRLGVEQAVDVETAVAGYTREASYLLHAERHAGTLADATDADLVVLSADPETTDPLAIRDLRVEQTIIGGEVAYERSSS